MFEPILTPLFSSLFSSLIDGPAAIQRILITLDPVLESHYTIQNPVVETGDFELSIEIASVSTGFSRTIISGSLEAQDSIVLDYTAVGDFRAFAFVGTTLQAIITSPASVVLDGKLRSVGLRYNNSTGLAELLLNNSVAGSATWALNGSQDVAHIGSRGGSAPFFDGVIANVDLGNGNAWKINRATGNTEQAANGNNILTYNNAPASTRAVFTFNQNTNRWVGAGLFDGLFTAGGGGSIDTVSGVTTVTNAAGGFDYARNTNALETIAGSTYETSVNMIGGTSIDTLTFGAGSTIGGVELGNDSSPGAGVKSFDFVADNATTFMRIGTNISTTGFTLIFNGLLVQRFIEVA